MERPQKMDLSQEQTETNQINFEVKARRLKFFIIVIIIWNVHEE